MTTATRTDTIRAGIYARQSLNKTGEQRAVDRLVQDGYDICKARGWTAVEEFIDDDKSASDGGARKDYQRLLRWIADGKLDAVATPEHDRLHRTVIEQIEFVGLARARNIKFASNSGEMDLSTDDGEFMAILFAALAQKEVKRKGARQRSASKQMAENEGRPWWPQRPFGYEADPDPSTGKWWTIRRDTSTKKILAVNEIRKHPTEAKLLREAYQKFLAGSSTRSLAKFWNDAGVLTPQGNKWTGSAIHNLLAAPRYAGLRGYGGEIVGKGTWPEIVDEDTWRTALRKLKDPSRRRGASRARERLLSNLARCGVCKGPLAATKTAQRSGAVRKYVCRNQECRKVVRNGEKLDQLVIERVVWRLSRKDAVDLLRPPVDPVDANELRQQRKTLNDRLVDLGKDFATAPPEFTKAAVADIQARLAEIDEKLTDPGKARVFEGVIGAKDVRKAFLGLDLGRQRTIIDTLMTVTVNPVGKARKVFDTSAIDLPWKKDMD